MGMSRNLVIDASALLAVILDEPERERLVTLTMDRRLASPGCLPWEMGNAFLALVRRKSMTVADAERGLTIFKGIRIRLLGVDLASSMHTAAETGLYAYDAYYIECARKMRAPLLTLDRRMRQVARTMGVPAPEV